MQIIIKGNYLEVFEYWTQSLENFEILQRFNRYF